MGIFYLVKYTLLQTAGVLLIALGLIIAAIVIFRKTQKRVLAAILGLVGVGILLAVYSPVGKPMAQYPSNLVSFGPGSTNPNNAGPAISFAKVIEFFRKLDTFERPSTIAASATSVGEPIGVRPPKTVVVALETKEVIAEMADGIQFNYWTFNGQVPGPFIRVREGDTVELTLTNNATSLHYHNIDLHAVTGPGGGSVVTNVGPGETKKLTFKALNPGLFVYHCAHPNHATHMAHGMYGLILVEPAGGLPRVDHEFYVMQGEFYSTGALGKKGLQIFDAKKMLGGQPEYVVFNGKVGGLSNTLQVKTGETVRLFVGNGGVNLISSFHVIGEIFDRVYPEGAIGSDVHKNIQTTTVPAGGAAIVEFTVEVPGTYVLVDHALARLDRGAWGVLNAEGPAQNEIYRGDGKEHSHDHE